MSRRWATLSKAGPKLSPHADIETPLSPKLPTHWMIRTAGAAELESEAMQAGDTAGIGAPALVDDQ